MTQPKSQKILALTNCALSRVIRKRAKEMEQTQHLESAATYG